LVLYEKSKATINWKVPKGKYQIAKTQPTAKTTHRTSTTTIYHTNNQLSLLKIVPAKKMGLTLI
jgi:hypothetical protein